MRQSGTKEGGEKKGKAVNLNNLQTLEEAPTRETIKVRR